MSSGLDCQFAHLAAPQGTGWYYFLETYPIYGPDGGDYDAYGPFPTYDKATEHLRENHQNPGGWSHDSEDSPPRIPMTWEAANLKRGTTR